MQSVGMAPILDQPRSAQPLRPPARQPRCASNSLSRSTATGDPARPLVECQRFTLALIDLDRFKEVNDSLGHASGDELLQNVVTRFARASRAPDPAPAHSAGR